MPRKASAQAVPGAWTPPQRESPERTSLDDDQSPPRTPPAQITRVAKSKGNGRGPAPPRPSVPGAFEARDGEGEMQQQQDTRARADSHDLSWSPQRQRRSVLENMLLSLDQAAGMEPLTQPAPAVGVAGGDESKAANRYNFPTPRDRSNTIESSVSSQGYSPAFESPPQHHPTRSHRSNSSLTFQTSLGRIDSIRHASGGKEPDIPDEPDPIEATPKAVPAGPLSALRRTSHGSISSSVDLGHPAGQWRRDAKRRSRSFDQRIMHTDPFASFDRRAFHFASAEEQAAASAIYDSLEAAPMPTVPGGPRRHGDSLPTSPVVESTEERSSRRGSLRSPMSYFARPERSQSPKRGEPRMDKVDRPSNLRHGSSYDDENMPSQSMDLLDHSWPGMGASTPAFHSQRQGFFRRVFNSAKMAAASDPALQSSARAMSESVPGGAGRLNSMTGESTSEASQQAMPPSNSKMSKKTETERPALNKKSSFFRRRKKSISQSGPVPELPPQLQPELPSSKPSPGHMDTSPSSLRQALDPYLTQPRPLDAELQGYRSSYDDPSSGRANLDSDERSTIRAIQRLDESELAISDSPRHQARKDSVCQEAPSQFARQSKKKLAELTIDADIAGNATTTERSIRQSVAKASASGHRRNLSDVNKSLPTTPTTAARTPASAVTSKENIKPNSPRSQKSPRGKGKKKSIDASINGMIGTRPPVMPSDDRTNSVAAPGQTLKDSSGGEEARKRIFLVPDPAKQSPTPPPPPTSPNAVEPVAEPFPRASVDEGSDYNTAESNPPSPAELARLASAKKVDTSTTEESADAEPTDALPSEDDRDQAQKLFSGSGRIERGEAAAWLGEEGMGRARIREAYMSLFDWTNTDILGALRSFCSQTRLKGETQQVDRVLDSLSTRWCECNPNHGFKATDVVHTICYSILLLNTDLHLANIDSKMTRNQFIKNTMPTIRRVVADAAPDAFHGQQTFMTPPSWPPPAIPTQAASTGPPTAADFRRPTLTHRPSNYSDSDAMISGPHTPVEGSVAAEDCGPLVNVPFTGKQTAWELQVEVVLKNFYNSIRQERLFLFRSDVSRGPPPAQQPANSLSAPGGSLLRRSNSMVSKADSESFGTRGRGLNERMGIGSRWSSKTRSRPRMYPPSSSHGQSRISFDDDGASATSPSAPSLWSRVSLGRTQASMSVNSLAMMPADYHQSIGFANALSQAIIREECTGDGEESLKVRPLLEDESLELAGAPWAKEGILKHKHHLEAVDKKAKDRSWVECFAVVEKGWMRLFQFNMNAKSLRQKGRGKPTGGVVGGGNWTENAEPMGAYLLRQSIATALPPPGYSKTRPHVWALSLPTGAVHLFQAGTPEIVKEFVSSANYWSARMSKEPLVGGVSNIEYGWSDAVVNMALANDGRASIAGPRPSMQGSIRSSMDQSGGASTRPRLPADRIYVSEWAPPMQSTMPSQLMEVDQLRALTAYVANIEQELKKHNNLLGPMSLAYTPRHPNCIKAMNNWERKSSYLLQEIVKFSTYIDSLRAAQTQQDKIYAEREEREKEKDEAAEAQGLANQAEAAQKGSY